MVLTHLIGVYYTHPVVSTHFIGVYYSVHPLILWYPPASLVYYSEHPLTLRYSPTSVVCITTILWYYSVHPSTLWYSPTSVVCITPILWYLLTSLMCITVCAFLSCSTHPSHPVVLTCLTGVYHSVRSSTRHRMDLCSVRVLERKTDLCWFY